MITHEALDAEGMGPPGRAHASCEACLALPAATSPSVAARIGALKTLAGLFGVPVVELDVDPVKADAVLIDEADRQGSE